MPPIPHPPEPSRRRDRGGAVARGRALDPSGDGRRELAHERLVDRLLGDTLAGTVEEELVGALDGLLEAQEDLRYLEFSGIAIVSDFVQVVHDDAWARRVAREEPRRSICCSLI